VQQTRTVPNVPQRTLADSAPQRRATPNATSAPTRRRPTNAGPLHHVPPPTATTSKFAGSSSAGASWFRGLAPPLGVHGVPSGTEDVGQMPPPAATGVDSSRQEAFVVLNPPRSNTKGRKKGRAYSGIELQAKTTTLCSVCGEPGHNATTCRAALGNR
jgi:hypothetical protein